MKTTLVFLRHSRKITAPHPQPLSQKGMGEGSTAYDYFYSKIRIIKNTHSRRDFAPLSHALLGEGPGVRAAFEST